MYKPLSNFCLYHACVHAKSLQLCQILRDRMDCSLPGSSVHGILQARILEWVAIPFSRGSSWSRDQTCATCIGGQIIYHWATREARAYPWPFPKSREAALLFHFITQESWDEALNSHSKHMPEPRSEPKTYMIYNLWVLAESSMLLKNTRQSINWSYD